MAGPASSSLASPQFPIAQLVPAAQGFKPFEIVEAGLWSRSWRGDLAALVTDWFGAWPWTQRSVHALGRDTDTPRARSLVLCVALAPASHWLGSRSCSAGGYRGCDVAGVVTPATAWLALDIVWQAGFWGRLQTTRAVYAHAFTGTSENSTVVDTDVAAEADKRCCRCCATNRSQRGSSSKPSEQGYELLRFIWHLLPRNVAATPTQACRRGAAGSDV